MEDKKCSLGGESVQYPSSTIIMLYTQKGLRIKKRNERLEKLNKINKINE